jgi:hypothetical protein
LQKFGMTDHATFGVSFESDDLFVPAVDKKAQASKKVDADDSSSNKPGHVLKSLLPAGARVGSRPVLLAIGSTCWVVQGQRGLESVPACP